MILNDNVLTNTLGSVVTTILFGMTTSSLGSVVTIVLLLVVVVVFFSLCTLSVAHALTYELRTVTDSTWLNIFEPLS